MKYTIHYTPAVLLFIVLGLSSSIFGQLQPNLPPSPEAAGLGSVVDVPIGEYSGAFNYGLPIHTLSYRGAAVGVSISYASGGIRVSDEATQVGLGWNLNAGGMITRSIRGGDDFGSSVHTGYYSMVNNSRVPSQPGTYGWQLLNQENTIKVTTCYPELDCKFEEDNGTIDDENICPVGTKDLESDLYTFSFGNFSGKFIIDNDGAFKVMDNQDLEIRLLNANNGHKQWVITDNQGVTYHFGNTPNSRQSTWTKSVAYTTTDDSNWSPVPPPDFGRGEWNTYVSAWYLTKVELPSKINNEREIAAELTYDMDSVARVKTIPSFSENHSLNLGCSYEGLDNVPGCNRSPPVVDVKRGNRVMNVMEYDEVNITTIETPYEKLVFDYNSSTRSDVVNAMRLDEIRLFTKKGGSVNYQKSWNLSYETSVSEAPEVDGSWEQLLPHSGTVRTYVDDDANKQRLILTSVTEEGKNGSTLPPTTFEYNPVQLPVKTSFATDSWGYFNGEINNKTFLKYYRDLNIEYLGRKRDVFIDGSSKDINASTTKAQHLVRVISPLGGTTEFEMEGNTYLLDGYKELRQRGNKQLGLQANGQCWTSLSSLNSGSTFTIDNGRMDSQPAKLRFELDWARLSDCPNRLNGENCSINDCFVGGSSRFSVELFGSTGSLIKKWDSDFTESVPVTDPADNGYLIRKLGVDYLEVANGDYYVKVKTNINGHTYELPSDFAYLGIEFSWDKYEYLVDDKVGGLRVATATYSPGDGLPVVYHYEYTDEDGKSSGIPVNLPKESFSEPEYTQVMVDCNLLPNITDWVPTLSSCWNIRRSSQSYTPLSSSMFGKFTGYSQVTKKSGLNAENGYTTSTYYNVKPSFIPELDRDRKAIRNGISGMYTQRNGRLETQDVYNAQGTLLQSTVNTYEPDQSIGDPVWMYKIARTDNFNLRWIPSHSELPPPSTSMCLANPPTIIAYLERAEWNKLLSSTTTTYDQLGDKSYVTTQSQTFDENSFVTLSSTVDGPGGSKTTTYKYATDFPSSHSHLLDARMTGVPISTEEPDGTSSLIYYDKNRMVPFKATKTFADGTTIETGRINRFNSRNNPVRVTKHGFEGEYVYEWSADDLLKFELFNEHKKSYAHNSARQVERITGIDGQATSFLYDDFNRLENTTARGGKISTSTVYQLGGTNKITKTTEIEGAPTIVEESVVDGMGRPLTTKVNEITQSSKTYDAFGRLQSDLYMPGYGSTTYDYEASPLGRVVNTNFPGGTVTTEYRVDETNGGYPLIRTTDENGKESFTVTDVFGRTVKTIDAEGGETNFSYTEFDAPLEIVAPNGSIYSYTYHKIGNLLASKTVPDGGTTSYAYSDNLRLKATKLANTAVISVAYDGYGRQIKTTKEFSGFDGLNWGRDFADSDFKEPLTVTEYHKSVIHNIKTGAVKITKAALIMSDGKQGKMVTTTYDDPDPYGRVLGENLSYSVYSQSGNLITNTSQIDHRDLPTQTTTTHKGVVLGQAFTYDDFARVRSANTTLQDASASANPASSLNVNFTYNDAGQVLSRNLLPRSGGQSYGELMKYAHPRGWLTNINQVKPQNSDTDDCDEPEGDVYEGDIEEQEMTITSMFDVLRNGNTLSVPDLVCDYEGPTEGCVEDVEVSDYSFSIENPMSIGTGDFVNRASIPCPGGSDCSPLVRTRNLQSVSDIKITGIKAIVANVPTRIPLDRAYSLKEVLMSKTIQGSNNAALTEFRSGAKQVAAQMDKYIHAVEFAVHSDADACTDCVAGGAKNYAVDVTFSKSALEITDIEVEYNYSVNAGDNTKPTNGVFVEDVSVGSSGEEVISAPCPPYTGGNGDNCPTCPGALTNDNDDANLNLSVTRVPFRVQLNPFQESVKANSMISTVKFVPQSISAQDSNKVLIALQSNCNENDNQKGLNTINKQSAANWPELSQELHIKKVVGRRTSNLAQVDMDLPGKPYRLATPSAASNNKEINRLKADLQNWLNENEPSTASTLQIKASDDKPAVLTFGPSRLQLIFVEVANVYTFIEKCPDQTTDTITVTGNTYHLDAWRTRSQQTSKNWLLQRPAGNKSFDPVAAGGGGVPLGGTTPTPVLNCSDTELPSCSAAETAQQLEAVANSYNTYSAEYLEGEVVYPTTLYSVVLCDGSVAYLLQDELNSLPGDYNVIGQLPINSPDQLLTVRTRSRNNPLFALSLDYYSNGNIRDAKWKTTYQAPNNYRYNYDDLNRLIRARYNGNFGGPRTGLDNIFNVENITYDAVGNIQTLNRRGIIACDEEGNLADGYIDQLTYGYYPNSNRLQTVTDAATEEGLAEQGVKPHTGAYTYDAAGRMTGDPHRGMTITYNHLDLPATITVDGKKTHITYDATGRKWMQSSPESSVLYVGPFTYKLASKDFELEAANLADGRIVHDTRHRELFTEYYHKDHLGNIRVAFTDRNDDGRVSIVGEGSEITQQNDFYPFGMAHAGEGASHGDVGGNRYRYNGKELNEDLSLYDYGARYYDPATARWGQVDPLADMYQSWSSYNYVLGNPIRFIDPNGMEVINADAENLNEKEKEHEAAQLAFEKTRASLGGVSADSKKSDFASKGNWQTFKSSRKALKKANRNLSNAQSAFDQSATAIAELQSVDPDAFQALDNLEDANGNNVDVLVTSRNNISQPGQTLFGYEAATSTLFSSNPNGGNVVRNAVQIQLNSGIRDPGRVLAHEGGHVRDVAAHPAERWNRRAECAATNCRKDKDHWFATPALQAENRFIKLRFAARRE